MTRRAAENDLGCCPACRRPFRSVLDFPIVVIEKFEQLPPPEAIDRFSREARSKRWSRRSGEADRERRPFEDGINATPEIAAVLDGEAVRGYFHGLENAVGHAAPPDRLLPPWKAHDYFRGAYPIPQTRFLLSLREAEDSSPTARFAVIKILCDGINFGSGGGPTLSVLGDVARIEYRGLLEEGYVVVHSPPRTSA